MTDRSYAHVPSKSSFLYTSLPDLLDSKAQSIPDKEAYVFRARLDKSSDNCTRQCITFRELSEKSESLAAAMLDFGVRPHDRLAVFGRPSTAWLLLDFAMLRIKVILVRLPESLIFSDNLPDFLSSYRCRALVLFDDNTDSRASEVIKIKLPEIFSQSVPGVCLDNKQYPQYVIYGTLNCSPSGSLTLADIINNTHVADDRIQAVRKIQKSINPEEPAIVYPTSGSTGIPKMVVHSHFGVVNSLRGVPADSVFYNDRLFSWMSSAYYLPPINGLTYVHGDERSFGSMEQLIDILEQEKVTLTSLPVYLLQNLVSGLDDGSLKKPSALVAISTSGERTPPSLRSRLLRHIVAHSVGYGSTEGTGACSDVAMAGTYTPPPDDEAPEYLSVSAGVETRVLGPDGSLVPVGQMGELWTRTATGFQGYLDKPEITADVLTPTGWFNTGDLAIMSAEKKLCILGRAKEMISKGGCKVLPSTIVSTIKRHTAVHDAYVIGIPDDRYGQEVGAFIIASSGEDITKEEIRTFCEANMDAKIGISLVPRYILIGKEIPMLETGKVDRLTIRDLLLKSE